MCTTCSGLYHLLCLHGFFLTGCFGSVGSCHRCEFSRHPTDASLPAQMWKWYPSSLLAFGKQVSKNISKISNCSFVKHKTTKPHSSDKNRTLSSSSDHSFCFMSVSLSDTRRTNWCTFYHGLSVCFSAYRREHTLISLHVFISLLASWRLALQHPLAALA